MKKLKFIISFTSLLLVLTTAAYAQGPGFGDDVVDDVPLDGGISLLVAAGIGYGAKKLNDAKKKSAEEAANDDTASK